MEFGAISHVGKVRKLNEDSYFVSTDYPMYFVVADGMGGHSAGEVASRAAIESIKKYVEENKEKEDAPSLICGAIRRANSEIYKRSYANPELKGMGTTLDLCLYNDSSFCIGHVGDSRVYKITKDSMERITTDHSLVEMLLRSGDITEEEAKEHPQKNIITRAVGAEESVEIDICEAYLNEGEVLLMCSDGLTNMVPESEIQKTVNEGKKPKEIVQKLLDLANKSGGLDNITIIII